MLQHVIGMFLTCPRANRSDRIISKHINIDQEKIMPTTYAENEFTRKLKKTGYQLPSENILNWIHYSCPIKIIIGKNDQAVGY